MYEMTVQHHFDAAHQLRGYEGKCHQTHGHRWDVEVYIKGDRLNSINMLVDFSSVKGIIDQLDHGTPQDEILNEVLGTPNPTAEFIAEWIYYKVQHLLDGTNQVLKEVKVTVWESPECSVMYTE